MPVIRVADDLRSAFAIARTAGPFERTKMGVMMTVQLPGWRGAHRLAAALRLGSTRGRLIKSIVSTACATCIAMAGASSAAPAQQQKPAPAHGPVTALVIMTPNGPASCATWVQWRLPSAHPTDKAAVEYWVEGYLSGLAAGSHHDVIGQFRRDALAAWLDRYCAANPQTKLPAAVNALGLQMLAHPGGPL